MAPTGYHGSGRGPQEDDSEVISKELGKREAQDSQGKVGCYSEINGTGRGISWLGVILKQRVMPQKK